MGRISALLAAWCLASLAAFEAKAADLPVDLELVLAIDISGSIDADEAKLQRQGYVDALRDPEIHKAIKAGVLGRIAITYFEWSSFDHKSIVAGWTLIDGPKAAMELAAYLAEVPVRTGMRTSITGAVLFAMPMFEGNGFQGTRRVIDVSGDGPNNDGGDITEARDEAVAKGITINGLPIINERPNRFGFPVLQDLDKYYEACVIGGPGAFVVVARDFDSFAAAVRRKMLLEIAGMMPPARHATRAVAPPRQMPPLRQLAQAAPLQNRQGYPGGCDVGERQSRDFWRQRYGPN
jgi:hypothetical protein